MRYKLSDFRKNFFDLMQCNPSYSSLNHVFKTRIEQTEIVAKANDLDHIEIIKIRTQMKTGLFVSNKEKIKEMECHVKCYIMTIGSLINMDPLEIQMMIDDMMLRRIPYTGKGIVSRQWQIENGWEIEIRIPIVEFETSLHKFNSHLMSSKNFSAIDASFSAESFVYNLNKNLRVLDSYGIKVTEVNVGELNGNPMMLAQFSDDTFIILPMQSDYKHFTGIILVKMEKETMASFLHKQMAVMLCFLPDAVKTASLFLENITNDVIELPVKLNGYTKNIKIVKEQKQQDLDKEIFSVFVS